MCSKKSLFTSYENGWITEYNQKFKRNLCENRKHSPYFEYYTTDKNLFIILVSIYQKVQYQYRMYLFWTPNLQNMESSAHLSTLANIPLSGKEWKWNRMNAFSLVYKERMQNFFVCNFVKWLTSKDLILSLYTNENAFIRFDFQMTMDS